MRVNPETGGQFATMMVQDEGEPLADLNQVNVFTCHFCILYLAIRNYWDMAN